MINKNDLNFIKKNYIIKNKKLFSIRSNKYLNQTNNKVFIYRNSQMRLRIDANALSYIIKEDNYIKLNKNDIRLFLNSNNITEFNLSESKSHIKKYFKLTKDFEEDYVLYCLQNHIKETKIITTKNTPCKNKSIVPQSLNHAIR